MSAWLHIFSGNDDFSIKQQVAKWIRERCGESPEDNPALEIIRGDSDTEKYDELLDQFINALTTPPFLTPEKIVWLRHFNKFDEAFAEPSSRKRRNRLDYIAELFKEGLADRITVVIDGPGLDRKRSFYKTCSAICQSGGGSMNWFEKIDPKARDFSASMTRKVRELCSEAGKRISADAAAFLAETSGGDLPRLKNELDKLLAYTDGQPEITLPDCHTVCAVTPEALSWEFSGALAERNAARAIALIPAIVGTLEQGSSGKVELAILGAVSSEFKKLLTLKCEGERYSIPDSASPAYFENLFAELKSRGVKNSLVSMHPFRAFKMWGNVKRFSPQDMADVFDAIFEANRAIVTGADARRCLESLAIRVAGGTKKLSAAGRVENASFRRRTS